jgi:hypothetical protein
MLSSASLRQGGGRGFETRVPLQDGFSVFLFVCPLARPQRPLAVQTPLFGPTSGYPTARLPRRGPHFSVNPDAPLAMAYRLS